MNRRSSPKYYQNTPLTYHMERSSSDSKKTDVSVSPLFKLVLSKLLNDIKALFAGPFTKNDKKYSSYDKEEARSANQAEHDMVATISREEEESLEKYSMTEQQPEILSGNEIEEAKKESAAAENKTAVEEKKEQEITDKEKASHAPVQEENKKESKKKAKSGKATNKKNDELGIADLFSIPSADNYGTAEETNSSKEESADGASDFLQTPPSKSKMSEIRKAFLADKKKRASNKINAKRKLSSGDKPLSQEEAFTTISILRDLLNDFDSLDNDRVKGRLEFAKKNLNKEEKQE